MSLFFLFLLSFVQVLLREVCHSVVGTILPVVRHLPNAQLLVVVEIHRGHDVVTLIVVDFKLCNSSSSSRYVVATNVMMESALCVHGPDLFVGRNKLRCTYSYLFMLHALTQLLEWICTYPTPLFFNTIIIAKSEKQRKQKIIPHNGVYHPGWRQWDNKKIAFQFTVKRKKNI